MTWDLNLCLTWDRKILIPFHHFVSPQPQCPSTSPKPFPLLRLPTDIQLIIYESCDLSTLFHLMHTSSTTRGPCTKLFWANDMSEMYWYHCAHNSLFEYGTHHHPIITHDLEFAARITRVELSLLRLEFHFSEDEEKRRRRAVSTVAKAQDFWEKVKRVFPQVRMVVMAGMLPQRALPPPEGDFDQDYSIIETVVQSAPKGIDVKVALDDGGTRPRRYTLWHVSKSTWSVLDADWEPTRILLPSRKFPASPLGDLLTFTRRNSALGLEGRGMNWLKIESYARYAADGVIHCPRLDCPSTFSERSQWEAHLKATSHWRLGPDYGYWGEHMMELLVWKGTPQNEQDALEARQERIAAAYRQTKKLQRRVGCGWNEEGTEARRLFEEQFFAELREENFLAPGELLNGPEDPYCLWMDCLWMYYDPTHVYYAGE
jgi:hypothetical protein